MHDVSRICTDRLVLAFPTDGDVEDIYRACQDPLIQAYTQCPTPYTRQDAEWFVHEYTAQLRAEGTGVWVIRTKAGAFLGVVDFHDKNGKCAELGYWVGADQRGHGYIVEAAHAALGIAAEKLRLDFVFARIEQTNLASLAAARSIGFTVNALLPGAIYLKGTHRDAYYCTKWLTHTGAAEQLGDPLELVRHFHSSFGLPVRQERVDAAVAETATRWQLIGEEFCELLESLHGVEAVSPIRAALNQLGTAEWDADRVDTVAATDAVADLLYVLYGMVLETNMPIRQVFAEVHRANMSKLGADGRPVLRADGKVVKGPNYRAPELRPILYPQD